jgi:hypothetical protein
LPIHVRALKTLPAPNTIIIDGIVISWPGALANARVLAW